MIIENEKVEWECGRPPAPGWYYTFQRSNRGGGVIRGVYCWRWWNGEWWSVSARPGWSLKSVAASASKRGGRNAKTDWCYVWPTGDHPHKPAPKKFERSWPDGTPKSLNNAFTSHILEK